MKKYIAVLIPLLIFWLSDSAWVQQKPENATDKNKTEKKADKEEKSEQDRITTEEGKKIFESLSEEEKKEILKRWEELKKLPEEERQKAIDNYYRMLAAEKRTREEATTEKVDPDTPETPVGRPEMMLANVLYMTFYGMNRERNERHMRLIFAIQNEDPYFFYKMKFLETQEERYELLIKKRDELFDKEVNEIAKRIELDEMQTQKLKQILKKQRESEDKIEMSYIEKQVKAWDEAYEKITSDTELYSKIKNMMRVFQFSRMQPGNPDGHGQRRMHGQANGFVEKHTTENWKSIIEKLNLSEEKANKLVEGYAKIYEKYKGDFSTMEQRREFKAELDKLIEETLTKEEIQQLQKLFGPGAFRNERGPQKGKHENR